MLLPPICARQAILRTALVPIITPIPGPVASVPIVVVASASPLLVHCCWGGARCGAWIGTGVCGGLQPLDLRGAAPDERALGAVAGVVVTVRYVCGCVCLTLHRTYTPPMRVWMIFSILSKSSHIGLAPIPASGMQRWQVIEQALRASSAIP